MANSRGPTLPAIQRFWKRVNKSGPIHPTCGQCWVWIGTNNGVGYGLMKIDGVRTYVHRYSWLVHKGSIPDGLWVLHKCDNPSCVNPAHLFLGDYVANMADMRAKLRQNIGTRNGFAKLTEDDVRDIRDLWKTGCSPRWLAREFDTCKANIWLIVTGKTWKHL